MKIYQITIDEMYRILADNWLIAIFVLLMLVSLMMLIVFSVGNTNIKFNKIEWTQENDCGSNPWRESMVDDLRANHGIIGSSYENVVERLGYPDSIDSTSNMVLIYTMSIDWDVIDPVSGTNYWVILDSNRVAKSDSVYKWSNKD